MTRAKGVLAAVVLLLVVVAAAGWWRAAQGRADGRERAAVEAVAEAFGAALFTYDHRDMDTARDRLEGLVTPAFATTYATVLEGGLAGEIAEVDARSEGEVREVFLPQELAEPARVIVVVDATVVAATGTRELEGAYLELELRRVDGRWRVDELATLTAVDERFVPADEVTS